MNHISRLLPALLFAAFAPATFAQTKFTRMSGALLFGPADKPAAIYRLVPPPNSGLPVEAGGYFHPLTTPRGMVVTDFVPADHKHHRGVFMAWVEMHGAADADFWGWGAHAPIKDRRIVNRDVALEPAGGFTATNVWLAGDTLVLTEKVTTVPHFSADAHVLDLTYRLTPTADTTLAPWAFSGFCVRFPKIGEATFHGPQGVVTLPNPSHEEAETDWPAAPWYAATWKTPEGAAVGVAVVNDARNPPALWHNHRDVRMINPAITAPAAVVLKAGVETVLRYRVVAFDGEVPVALLNASSAAPAAGELKLTSETPAKTTDLSAAGKSDWAHWGRIHGVTILNRKQGVPPIIGELVKLGVRELHTFENNPTTFTWTDGAPAAEVKHTRSGVFTYGHNAGFQIILPADTTVRTAKVFVGVWRGRGHLEATLSDGSAPLVTAAHDGVEPEAGDNLVYTLRYRAASAGQTLSLKWTNVAQRGNVTWQAVTIDADAK